MVCRAGSASSPPAYRRPRKIRPRIPGP
jgi:hypothetical protein